MTAAPVKAAALVLRAPDGRVLISKRAGGAPFLGGYLAFVGGKEEPEDEEFARSLFSDPSETARAAALREMREETGLDLCSPPAPDAPPASLPSLLDAGRWVTPSAYPMRFDTAFFLVDVLEAAELEVCSELEWARWATPEALLDGYQRLEHLLAPPTLAQLAALARVGASASPEAAAAALRQAALEGDHGAPTSAHPSVAGVWQLPLKTPTLPPATHTNCYVVGEQRVIVVDPAPYEPSERERLAELLEARRAAGAQLEQVVLTHHHPDHFGASTWVAERFGLLIAAHPETARLLEGEVRVDRTLVDGDRIDLGLDASGEPFVLEVLHTPGHAGGHLCLRDLRRGGGGMIVGDMVASVGSIIIDPDEGDMSAYLEQLQRLRGFADQPLHPAHGGTLASSHAKLDAYLAHRLGREAKVLRALSDQPRAVRELLPSAYADVPETLWPMAERACKAHIDKLVREGRARSYGGIRFSL